MSAAGGSRPRPSRSEDVARALAGAADALRAAGVPDARLDAELLLAEALGEDRAIAYRDPGRPLARDEHDRLAGLVARRAAREPYAYVVGRRGFRRIELAVDPRVLVPRPETELLVEVGLELPQGARVADVGTGSGAVALALADERPDLLVVGSDRSEDALEVARANARRLGLAVTLVHADLVPGDLGPFDAVLSNPPYVPSTALDALEPEVALHEPREALDGGADGLDVVRRLVGAAAGTPLVAVEVGAGQAPAVRDLARAAGASVEVRRDLAGIERVVVMRWG